MCDGLRTGGAWGKRARNGLVEILDEIRETNWRRSHGANGLSC
jgi:hypothetical protein